MKTNDKMDKQQQYFPNGWVIKTYKHMNIPKTDFNDTKVLFEEIKSNSDEMHQYKDITYGTYDRIQMLPVNGFSDFIQESNKAYDWYGMSQAILLFPLEKEDSKRHFLWGIFDEGDRERVLLRDDESSAVRALDGFYGTSFCYISDEIRSLVSRYDDLVNHCNKMITDLVNAYNKSVEENDERRLHGRITAEVFGSLSSAELIIMWSAQQYTDILYLMDCIRDFCFEDDTRKPDQCKYSIFRTTYTMISFFDRSKKDGAPAYPLTDILGKAHIQFVMQDGVGESKIEEFREFIQTCLKNSAKMMLEEIDDKYTFKLYRCAGEYDLVGNIKSKYIPWLFARPEDWHEPGWELDPEDPEYFFCSLHHPKYNEYVLYSFTRLGYKEGDLPGFAREKGHDTKCVWNAEKKKISRCNLGDISSSINELNIHRTDLIRKIERAHKSKFENLIQLIMQNVPATSNLITELNQLFSDYVQCCSSSADYVWIEDYNELFLHVLERVEDSVKLIDVWKEYEKLGTAPNEKDEQWENSRNRLINIRELLQSLHQHTNHISSSNKLFFREQKTHFGYTAQHDLVIHAYYDIIKRLINYIYSYTDKSNQSQLYPLVYFTPEDRISSRIYSEESIVDFLKGFDLTSSIQIPSRIMVIHIPLDGMDNLMHYLPMLIHEVYHYAAPKDRGNRNRILAKAITYQALRYGIGMIFIEEENTYFSNNLKDKNRAQEEFQELLTPILYDVINRNGEAIYTGIIEDYVRMSEPVNDAITDAMLLRSWFVSLMVGWLNNCKERFEGVSVEEIDPPICYNLSDLYRTIAVAVSDELKKKIEEQEQIIRNTEREAYRPQYHSLLVSLQAKLQKAIVKLDPKNEETSEEDVFLQELTNKTFEYINIREDMYKLLEQFDELFPDIAMVMHTQMPASGYMLQIALDLDKQLYNGKEFDSDQVRFISVLNYLLKKKADDEQEARALFEKELDVFANMYIASYRIASEKRIFDKEKTENRAARWRSAFMSMYEHQYSQKGLDSFFAIYKYTEVIIKDMEKCLVLEDDSTKKEQMELFVKPYKRYLDILKEDEIDHQKSELFKLSIEMIQRFQNYKTLRQINDTFVKKNPVAAVDKTENGSERKPFDNQNKIVYETLILSPDMYFTAVKDALMDLYDYRDMENISEAMGMWFRGVASINYPIVPSGFVHYTEDAARLQNGFPGNGNPCSYVKVQLYNYETFRYSAEGSVRGINPANYYQTINYLALMQHYQQHSNLVDWSEDYFGSSYFALADEIDVNDKYEYQRSNKDNYHNEDDDAVMYILDPVRLNKACEEIEKNVGIVQTIPVSDKAKINVFNLSVRENKTLYRTYHDFTKADPSVEGIVRVNEPDPMVKQDPISLEYLMNKKKDFVKENIKLPRAVYVAKLNDRIRAQSGLFVIYDLETIPVEWEGKAVPVNRPCTDLFYYQSLESIQEYYLTLPNKHPFLMKIRIPKSIKKELGRMLYKCGISREKIYPELSNYRHR